MKNQLLPSILLALLAIPNTGKGQMPFAVYDSIDIGNINAWISVHGQLWGDTSGNQPHCEFPKGSGKHIAARGGLWVGGYDQQNQLRLSAQSPQNAQTDFWPGLTPFDANGDIVQMSYSESNAWAKIWKVTREELNQHLANTTHTIANTPASILEWPGAGNIYAKGNGGVFLNIPVWPERTAPFVDLNNDGHYEPLQGEYPQIKGDQTLWFIFNNYGPTHNVSLTPPPPVEIQCMAYAYNRNTIADNIIFYEYQIVFTETPLDSVTWGLFTDFGLGDPSDDYIGFDSVRNLVFSYNGGSNDAVYGDTIPAVGVTVLKWHWKDTCGTTEPAGSFMYFNNSNDPTTGAPTNSVELYNYLTASWRNGQHLSNDYQGAGMASNGTGAGPNTQYVFNGDPANNTEWSECASLNTPGDRKTVLALKPRSVLPGQLHRFAFALLAAPPKAQNGCPSFTLQDLRALADTAHALYCTPPIYTNITNLTFAKDLKVYPNPTSGDITVEMGNHQNNEHLRIIDVLGRNCEVSVKREGSKWHINAHHLSAGVYYILLADGNRASFMKR